MRRIFVCSVASLVVLFCPAYAKDSSFQQYAPNYELPLPSDGLWPGSHYGAWRTWIQLESDDLGRYCYADSLIEYGRPIRLFFRSGLQTLFVRNIPKLKIRNEVSVFLAFTHHPKRTPVLILGKEEFPLIAQGDYAYLRDPAKQQRLLEAMKKNQTLTVRGTAEDGTPTEDRYGTRGLSEMLDWLQKECPS